MKKWTVISIKQNITKQDLEELTTKQAKALFTYWYYDITKPKNKNTNVINIEFTTGMKAPLPLLSIGDIMEFFVNKGYNPQFNINQDICDEMWGVMKKQLW